MAVRFLFLFIFNFYIHVYTCIIFFVNEKCARIRVRRADVPTEVSGFYFFSVIVAARVLRSSGFFWSHRYVDLRFLRLRDFSTCFFVWDSRSAAGRFVSTDSPIVRSAEK